ncbi:SUMF1/EgtB/PvdO family nonheme iron enzyme [Nocardia jejuensis]|uniref:SUMF1/EgtB/PvdO family nonheme iron enzyme n=1 Tax=Nocardia jejuensis TaxID=328049 RepID=UPI0009FD7ACB|nr:SUMF1/EgtB/PvdO family nonheme iron enzyme [Nocardia jejuensis]
MITMLGTWTGADVRALREARRMSIVEFAAHLGVPERRVEKWEAGGASIRPRPVNQAALDTSLQTVNSQERARFSRLVPDSVSHAHDPQVPAQPTLIRHPIDGKVMTRIPEGIYLAGLQEQPVWVAEFWVDLYPTTNADYARFVAATEWTPPRHWHGNRPPPELLTHPVVWVSWDDATAYAHWARKRLPSAPEWEKTARGTRGAIWPWGNQLTPAKCNCLGSQVGTTTPVDRYKSGVSPYGVYDLCGNTWEWTDSASTPGRYELKGSAFTSPYDRAAPAAVNDADHTMLDDDTGFRCVSSDSMQWSEVLTAAR